MARYRDVELLNRGVAAWNDERRRRDFVPDLSGVKLEDLKFGPIVNLFHEDGKIGWGVPNLRNVNFKGCKLRGVDFTRALLEGADFSDADVRTLYPASAHQNSIRTRFACSITQEQVNSMRGDTGVVLPDGLTHPPHWLPPTLPSGPDVEEAVRASSLWLDRASVEEALARNGKAAHFAARDLLSMIDEEIERIRGDNPENDIEHGRKDRRIALFRQIRGFLVELTEQAAFDPEESANTLSRFHAEILAWPRNNFRDIVDSTMRVSLVLCTAGVASLFGASPVAGAILGVVYYGGEKGERLVQTLRGARGTSNEQP